MTLLTGGNSGTAAFRGLIREVVIYYGLQIKISIYDSQMLFDGDEIMALAIAEYLRTEAMRCSRLALTCSHDQTKRELESLSLELAEKASELNADVTTAPSSNSSPPTRRWARIKIGPLETSLMIVAVSAVTLIQINVWFEPPHLIFAFLAPIIFVSIRHGIASAILATITSALCSAFFFYPPKFSFYIDEQRDFTEMLFFSAIALLAVQFIIEHKRDIGSKQLSEQ